MAASGFEFGAEASSEVWKGDRYIVNHGCQEEAGAVMGPSRSHREVGGRHGQGSGGRQTGLGVSLRRAWIGYQRRVDTAMAAAGFEDRRLPDGRVLRMCPVSAGTTISQIGRELGISRQGASKIVASLRDRGYVSVTASGTDGREKIVTVTPRAVEYLAAHGRVVRAIDRQLRNELGERSTTSLQRLLDALGVDDEARLLDYLRSRRI
jgi:DNA-binding MarR family transcriptional regulator